jgi:hypothetical protein
LVQGLSYQSITFPLATCLAGGGDCRTFHIVIWIALAILVLAWVVRSELRRITRVHGLFTTAFTRIAARAAERNGDTTPLVTEEDVQQWNDRVP